MGKVDGMENMVETKEGTVAEAGSWLVTLHSQSEIVADRNRKQNDQEVELGCKVSSKWKLKTFWGNYCNI